MNLNELKPHEIARVRDVSGSDPAMEAKLREVGFAEDDEVEVMHRGPITGNPLCIRLNETLVALRLNEASAIQVDLI